MEKLYSEALERLQERVSQLETRQPLPQVEEEGREESREKVIKSKERPERGPAAAVRGFPKIGRVLPAGKLLESNNSERGSESAALRGGRKEPTASDPMKARRIRSSILRD